MKTADLVAMTLAVVICAVIVVAVAIPILSDTDDIRSRGVNQTASCYLDEASNPNITIADSSGTVTVGDLDVTSVKAIGRTILACCDSFTLFTFSGGSGIYILSDELTTYKNATSVVIADGKMTYTPTGGSETSQDIEGKFLYISSLTTGKYAEYIGDKLTGVKINSDTKMYGYTNYTLTNPELDPTSVGVIEGFVGTSDNMNVYGSTLTTHTFSWNDLEESNGCLEFENNTFTVTGTNTTGTYSGSAGGTFIVPTTYTYISSNDSAMISIIGIIPMLLIVALIVGVVGYAFYTRK